MMPAAEELNPRLSGGPAHGGSADASALARALRDALAGVLTEDHEAVARLSYARTTVAFAIVGARERVTLLLDRSPPAVAENGSPAEVEIELSAEQAQGLLDGTLHTPSALAAGGLSARGPLRKYLEVDPILRGMLRERAGAQRPRLAVRDGAADGGLPDDLLAIQARDLHKRFGRNRVLAGANLAVPEGVISVVVGPSGTGKSVLLNHVIGLMRADRGEVLVRGRSLGRMSRSEVLALRLEIGVMFQDGALFSAMSLYDNVAFPLRQHTDMAESEVRDVVMRHLHSVGLSDAIERYPAELSGGMRKRAGLARAMVLDPGIILCDEPDSGLDPVRTALLAELLIEQHTQIGGTMLVITHDIALARRIGEHISVLWRGQIIESGMAGHVFNSSNEFVRQFLAGEIEGPLSMDA